MKTIKSVCPKCNKRIAAKIVYEKNKVYMIKTCPEHGRFKTLVDSDKTFYDACHNRPIKKLRHSRLEIPVTNKCNLDCSFCYAPDREKKDLTIKEISKLIDEFKGDYISLSGGEPTLRKDLTKIIKLVIRKNKIPVLNTNGLKLADENYVKILKKAGLRTVHFSFNGFKDDPFIDKNKKDVIGKKVKALDNLTKHKFSIVLSYLILKGKNENEFQDIIKFALDNYECIFELRIRSANLIGRYKDTGVYSTSEILDQVCSILKLRKRKLISEHAKLKGGKCLCKFCGFFAFYNNDCIGSEVYSREGKLTKYGLLSKYGHQHVQDLLRLVRINSFKNFFTLIRLSSILNGLKYMLKSIIERKKIRFLRIEIRSWPNRNNLDFDDVENCPSLGLSKDKKRMLPFCYRFFCDENIDQNDVALCKY